MEEQELTTPVEPAVEETPAETTEQIAHELGIELKEEESAEDTDELRVRALLEAIVYIAEEPMSVTQIAQALNQPKERVERLLADLVKEFEAPQHGLLIREVAGGFKMGTKPEFHEELRAFVKRLKPPLKLSLAALETLAVIAYKQPITAPEIMEIRGVQGAGVLKTLLERKLIQVAGRKQVVGRPVLYKTTKDFLLQFGLKDLAELPTLKEFEEWSRLAMGEGETEAPPEAEAPSETEPLVEESPTSGEEEQPSTVEPEQEETPAVAEENA